MEFLRAIGPVFNFLLLAGVFVLSLLGSIFMMLLF